MSNIEKELTQGIKSLVKKTGIWSVDTDETEYLIKKYTDYVLKKYDSRVMEFGSWPVFERGGKVKLGDRFVNDLGEVDEVTGILIQQNGYTLYGTDSTAEYEEGGEAKTPDTEVLSADGKPIEKGDSVYIKDGPYKGKKVIVVHIENDEISVRLSPFSTIDLKTDPRNVTYDEPETVEKVMKDAGKTYIEYYKCSKFPCALCPAKSGGKTPKERYGTASCEAAQKKDIANRLIAIFSDGGNIKEA